MRHHRHLQITVTIQINLVAGGCMEEGPGAGVNGEAHSLFAENRAEAAELRRSVGAASVS
jgi:hypothetical protein